MCVACVLINLYLQKQAGGQIWLMGCNLPPTTLQDIQQMTWLLQGTVAQPTLMWNGNILMPGAVLSVVHVGGTGSVLGLFDQVVGVGARMWGPWWNRLSLPHKKQQMVYYGSGLHTHSPWALGRYCTLWVSRSRCTVAWSAALLWWWPICSSSERPTLLLPVAPGLWGEDTFPPPTAAAALLTLWVACVQAWVSQAWCALSPAYLSSCHGLCRCWFLAYFQALRPVPWGLEFCQDLAWARPPHGPGLLHLSAQTPAWGHGLEVKFGNS